MKAATNFKSAGKTVSIFSFLIIFLILSCTHHDRGRNRIIIDANGAVIRKDTTRKVIHLVFTGHDHAEGFPVIEEVLNNHGIKASFFFTGDFYRNPDFKPIIGALIKEDHYLGAHSDKHLLYCSWENRDSLLVDRSLFVSDLERNYSEMSGFGIEKKEAIWFMPPYEWYNKDIASWTEEMGLILVNFSPGTRSNADYTYPEMGSSFVSSGEITESILGYEEKNGMNGFILLIHIGTDPRRINKYYDHLDHLVSQLKNKGYGFAKIDE